jgi:hypothetical protein
MMGTEHRHAKINITYKKLMPVPLRSRKRD